MTPDADRDPSTLVEVAESNATGEIGALYAAIRATLGTSTVALVYRVLAAKPGRLEHAWAPLAPNLRSEQARSSARALSIPDFDAARILPRRIAEDAHLDAEATASTLADFDHANRLNLLGLQALLFGADGGQTPQLNIMPEAPVRRVLPSADLTTLPLTTTKLLEQMSATIAGSERPILIPSLFRCFAYDERLLAALWRSSGPAAKSPAFTHATNGIAEQARSAARALPCRVAPTEDRDTRVIVTRFSRTIAGMILVTGLFGLALSDFLVT